MKQPSLLLWAFALFAFSVATAGAFDFGLTIDNSTAISAREDTSLVQADRLSLWLRSPLGEYWAFRLRGFGSITYDQEMSYKADLEQFHLSARVPAEIAGASLFSMGLGRYQISDFSRRIVSHRVDGISLGAIYPAAQVTFAAGYTGLVLNQSSQIFLSKADNYDTAQGSAFATPRAIAVLTLKFPELLLRQDVTLSLAAQEDLRPLLEAGADAADQRLIEEGTTEIDPDKGGAVDTQYMGLGLSGPIVAPVYYSGFFYLGTGRMLTFLDDDESPTGSSYQYASILSYLAGGGVKAFVESLLYSRIAVDLLYASGDSDAETMIEGNTSGQYTAFLPLTGKAGSLAFAPTLSNVFLASASYSLRPLSFLPSTVLSKLQAGVAGYVFLRPTTGAVSPAGLAGGGSPFDYLGSELDATVNFRPFSDLGLALRAGVFLPSTASGVFTAEYQQPKFVGSFAFSFTM